MQHKKGIIVLIILAVVVFINFVSLIEEYMYLEKRQKAGNERWLQVEKRIINIENRVEELEDGKDG